MIKRAVAAALVAAFFGASQGPAIADAPPTTHAGAQIQHLAQTSFQRFIAESPESATFLGDYSHDGDWSDVSPAFVAHQKQEIADLARRVDAIDMSDANLQDRDDVALVKSFIANQQRQIAELNEGKDPGTPPLTLVSITFEMILHKSEQNDSVWWDHMISRLEKAPAWLAGQRRYITHPGRIQAEAGIEQLAMAPALYNVILTQMAAHLPAKKKARFEHARDATVSAITRWTAWMTQHEKSWPVNYAMGKAAYNGMLKDELLLPYDSDQIAAIGERTLHDAIAQENAVLAQAKAQGVNLNDPVQAAAHGGGMTPLGKSSQFAFFQKQLDTLQDFIRDNHIVTVPPYVGKMRIEETPSFLLPIQPGASMNPPPLLSKQVDGIYFVPPPDPAMAKRAAAGALFEDFDRDRVLMTSGHEGFHGHFLQLSIAKHNADPVRRFSNDSVFAEGWAFYEEDLLNRMGLYGNDLDGRYSIAQFERLRGARAVVDTKLATGAWNLTQAIAWFQKNAGVDADTARGEVTRFALGPGQAFDYAVGKTQITELLAQYKAKKGSAFSLQAFHDDLLSHGTVPMSIVAKEMLAE